MKAVPAFFEWIRSAVYDRWGGRKFPWALPLMAGAWYLSFEALRYCEPFLRYLGHTNAAGELSTQPVPTHIQIKAAILAAVIDYAIWVGYVGLRRAASVVEVSVWKFKARAPGSARAWVLLAGSSAATVYFQAHWNNPASWVPPVALLLSLWVLEDKSPHFDKAKRGSATNVVAVPTANDLEVEIPAKEVARAYLAHNSDRTVTASEMAEVLDCSDGYARRLLRELRSEPLTGSSTNGSALVKQ